jgi:PAS domain S-box-containing protein
MGNRDPDGLVSTLFEALPVGVTLLGPSGRITRANGRAEEVLGLTDAEISERTYDDPAWEIVDERGEPIPAEELPFARVRATGEPVFESEHGIRWPDGSERWLSINAAPLDSGTEGPAQVVAVITDVTEQRGRKRTIQAQNERLAEFATIVSHDLRNPLSVFQGYLDLAEETGDPEHFARCRTAADRMETLISNLLDVARDGPETGTETVSIPEVAADCWSVVPTGDARLVVETDARVTGSRVRLPQLFENLYRNAVEHGSTGSQASPDDVVERDGDELTVRVGRLPGGAGLYVEDDGIGIPARDRERIFQGGYSTSDHGTGSGLTIVRQIADVHGWEVVATESPDGGARFEITGVEFADPAD